MSTPAQHRPAGTPDGGQFASMQRPEAADLQLDDQNDGESTWTALAAAYEARHQAGYTIEALSARLIADNIRSRFPTATTLHLEDSDQGAHFTGTHITDAEGRTLHEIEWSDDDSEIDTLASNFSNDSVSQPLTNHGTRRFSDYRLELAAHGTNPPAAETAEPWTSESVAGQELPEVPLADIHPDTPVYFDHPEVQAGAVRNAVIAEEGTVFHRRRTGVYPNEPYAMRFQANRPLDDSELDAMAAAAGYAYASDVRGEPMGQARRDSPYSFTIVADTTKSRRDDLGQALQDFESSFPEIVRDGSPIRKTDRSGPRGTRLVLGLNDPDLHIAVYYDSVTT